MCNNGKIYAKYAFALIKNEHSFLTSRNGRQENQENKCPADDVTCVLRTKSKL